ncbi:MAG: hypothetical protein ACI8Y4_005478, partial [Candidatus Poriferisodalaceae bacterium]
MNVGPVSGFFVLGLNRRPQGWDKIAACPLSTYSSMRVINPSSLTWTKRRAGSSTSAALGHGPNEPLQRCDVLVNGLFDLVEVVPDAIVRVVGGRDRGRVASHDRV